MDTAQMMNRAGRWTIRKARPILAVASAVTLIALYGTTKLGVDTDIANMLPAENPVARSFTAISREFDTTSTLMTVIEGPDRQTLIRTAEEFSGKIASDPRTASLVRPVRLKMDRDFAETWGFLLQDSDELADTRRIFAATRMLPLLKETNNLLEEKLSDGSDEEVEGTEGEDSAYEMMSRFGLFASRLDSALRIAGPGDNTPGPGILLADDWLFGEEYFIDPEAKTLMLIVRPNFDLGNRAKLSALSNGAAAIAADITAKENGQVAISFTGDVENEADEERAIGSDIFYPSLIAMILIVILFAFSFNRKRSILFALAALGAGIVADLGFASATVRNLNMITSSFGALLVGLGIDFGIHIVARYDEGVHSGETAENAMGRVFAEVAMPIFVGGLTTALAFYSLMLSGTVAFRQFGLVAGTGILTTLASSFTVLPALLALFPGAPPKDKKRALLAFALPSRAAAFARKHRVPVIALSFAITALCLFLIPRNSFEYDMRKIGPQNTRAQKTEKMVAARFGISTWQSLASADSLEEARDLQERFAKAPLVRRSESMADYIPSPAEQTVRLAAVAEIAEQKNRSAGADWTPDAVREFAGEIQRLEWNVIELGDLAAASLGENSLPVRKRNAMIREIFGGETGKEGAEVFRGLLSTLESIPSDIAADRLSRIDEAFAGELDKKIAKLASPPRGITLADIPADLRADLVNKDGSRYLVVIQGAADLSGDANFIRFADGLSAVDPGATGALTLGLELSREVLKDARSAAIIVAVIVFLIVGISFRSVFLTLITGAAFAAALVWMFGLSPFFGKFNIVNALALPLIIGVGIDYCVHVVSALQTSRSTREALRKTGKAVTLSMLTTVIGFGSLALVGRFKGIADLGTTLTLGILCCYLAAIVIVPACIGLADKTDEKEST